MAQKAHATSQSRGFCRAAGLHPVLLDPYDDHPDADFDRIAALGDLLALVAS